MFVSHTLQPNQAIAIFDSGIGGLSIAECIKQQLPNENLLYVADTGFAPYGDKSAKVIEQRVLAIAQWFISQQAKAIVVACNTATVNAIESLRATVSVPVIGVEPAIKPAAKQSVNKKVAVLVTSATAKNSRFLKLIAAHKNGSEVFVQPCPGLVELIEQGQQHSLACQQLLTRLLQPLLAQGVDTIVLGCTHYPFVKSLIQEICGNGVSIMETALPVTEQLKRQLTAHQLHSTNNNKAEMRFFSSANNAPQQQLVRNIWSEPLFIDNLPKHLSTRSLQQANNS